MPGARRGVTRVLTPFERGLLQKVDGAQLDAGIAEEYRRANGLPPHGIDPVTGERVGPSDGEIIHGGLLGRNRASPGAASPAPNAGAGAYPASAVNALRFPGGYQPAPGRVAPPGTEGFLGNQHFIVYADHIQLGGQIPWRCNNLGAVRARTASRARELYAGALSVEMHAPNSGHGFVIFAAPEHSIRAQEQTLAVYARRGYTVRDAMLGHYTDGDPRGQGYVDYVVRHFHTGERERFLPSYVADTARFIRGNEGPRAGQVFRRDAPEAWVRAVYGRPLSGP